MAPKSMENLRQVTRSKRNVRMDLTRESKKWNAFLVDLCAKLSAYNIQKDKKKYNVADIECWGKSGEKPGIVITKNTFNSFLNKIAQNNVTEYENIKKIAIKESQLVELNHILSLTLKHEVNKSCSMSNELVIKGDYIKFSDFIQNDGNITLTGGCKNVTVVNVFALNTIFVDRDIILTGIEININMISPKWDIISTRMIDLSGVESKRPEAGWFRTEEVPEKRGGNFFGIGAEFVNGTNFSIITNANRTLTSIVDRCTADWCSDDRKNETQLPIYRSCIEFSLAIPNLLLQMGAQVCQLSYYSTRTGLDNPGKIVLFELNNNSGISKYNNTEKGDLDRLIMLITNGGMLNITETHERVAHAIDGANGRDIQDLVEVKIINKYKHYLRDNLNDRFKKSHLIDFLHHLDNDDNVKSVYNTLELFDEFKDLEEQFYNFNNNADLLPVYRLLLNRISEYAQNPKNIENSSQYKKILIYLYTATLGKISYLKERSEANLIIDINKHLDLIKEDIDTLRNLQVAGNKANLINDYKQNFKRDIDGQIAEATYVIEHQITPEINNIVSRIDVQIDRLIREIKALEKLAEEEKSELIAKREQLKSAMKLRVFFGSLKMVGLVTSFFGPIGLAAGSLIGSSSAILESSLVNDGTDVQESLKSAIQSYVDQIKTANNEPINHLNELLEDVSLMINVHLDTFNDTAVKIGDMKNRLSKVDGVKFRQVQMIEIELKHELKRKGEDFTGSSKNRNTGGKAARAIAVMEKINKVLQVYEMGFVIYSKYKSDEANVNAITAAIAQKDQDIEQLQKYEKNIHDVTMSMLKNMEDTFRHIANELDTKSRVALDVTKWRVQSVLKDIKLTMKKLTRMFRDIHDDLPHCIEMMEDTMTTLINIYDRIQDYQGEQKFINFFADISYITGSDVIINDPRLGNIVDQDYLEKLIRSNQVIMKYKTAIEAFKNFVFPLAHEYLGDSVLPSHLQLERNFENLLSTATTQIEYVKSKIEIYKTYLNGAGYNPYIKLTPFTGHYISTDPFFRWENEQNNDLISKLLSGQKVTVRADIINSPAHKDAIKFSVAEFFFKARNETMQAEMSNVLKGFEIEAAHLGDSQYRCNGKIYLITSHTTNISYYLEKNADGEPVSKSVTYVKLKESDSILSPYATWDVVLMNTTNRITFKELQKYKDAVDLELVGYGSYIDNRRVNYANLTIENFYREVGTYNQLNLHTEPETIRRNVRSVDPYDHDVSSSALLDFLSPINNVSNFLREKLSAFKYPRHFERIKSWFRNDESEVEEETSGDSGFTHDDHDLFEFNQKTVYSKLPGYKVEQSSNSFIDGENNSASAVNYDLLNKQGNLLLLDLLFRKKNHAKYKNEDNAIKDYLDTEYAQNLAYSAYASDDISSNNSTYVEEYWS